MLILIWQRHHKRVTRIRRTRASEKPILVELAAMADSSLNITTKAWVKAVDYWSVHYSMNENVYKTFNTKGFIPYPQMDVHLHK